MRFNPECVTCSLLGACRETDATKVLSHFVCIRYKEVPEEVIVQARCDVINKYGAAGLKALVTPTVSTAKEA